MKATELRIGNYVVGKKWPEYDLELIVVTSVDDIGINLEEGLGEGIRREFYHHDISPIPLTPEILKKCGCTQGHDKEMWRNPIGVWLTRINGTNRFFIHGFRNGHYIEYLHQYQNACYDFTGEEIRLEL